MARLAGADESVRGAPGDPIFDTTPTPKVVVLGLAGDFEPELQFAHRMSRRLHGASWVLLAHPARHEEARRLFDTLDAQVLGYPPEAAALRDSIRRAPARQQGAPLPLSQRPARDALSARFGRAFADLELPALLRALDPQLIDVPILIAGESGTGRSLLARYIHAYSDAARGPLAEVACEPDTEPTDILAVLESAGRDAPAHSVGTVCLYEVDRLSPASQRRVNTWIEFAAPAGALHTRLTRWIGTVQDPESLAPRLRQTLAGLYLTIPPLRERPGAVEQVAEAAIEAWCSARGERPRQLTDEARRALEEYPWPGNVRELEAVIAQTLSAGTADPIDAGDLHYEGAPLVPLDAERVGVALPDEWTPEEFSAYEEALTELEQQPVHATDDPLAGYGPSAFEDAEEAVPARGEEPAAEAEDLAEPEPARFEEEDEEQAIIELEEEPEAAPVPPRRTAPLETASLPRLAGAVAHEVRNPLSTIRSFAQLLSERHDDPEFREQFRELVDQDALRIEEVVERLERLAAMAPPAFDSVDVTSMLQGILDDRRASIRERRLMVLHELDSEEPRAIGDADQLSFAFEALVGKSLELVPDGGDLYIASKHHPTGLGGRPSMRVLLRLRGPERKRAERELSPGREPVAGVSAAENALELAIAEIIVRAHGGVLAIDTSDGEETVIVLDLPA